MIIFDGAATRVRRRNATVRVTVLPAALDPGGHQAAPTASVRITACCRPPAGGPRAGSVAGGAAIPSPS
ncbi:hypothetical protein FRAAL0516 [Frankia alni ACN14a]|uniref:Uncharacterized protein n=1 Tax=Frankia alni (strain DSM 45986 / CECT 9034 / ACN14a) TaxID=326424 RepID=Q0RTB0_FRAAA|nr:hypothetical protein FRAAL0516 [Frankia alni ACN14a]